MATRRGNRHQITIDNQTVWLDSNNEEQALRQFINRYGFSGKWSRPIHGIKHVGRYYSPDFELAINDYGNTARAVVEVKEYRRDLTKGIIERMRVVANHYHTDCLFLYAVKKDEWYRIIKKSGIVRPCTPPLPGLLAFAELATPRRFVTRNYYGRRYHQSLSDSILTILRGWLYPPKGRRKR
jgi:hypothetical protein